MNVNPVPPPPPPPSKLSQILVEKTIGRQLAFFENITGPAEEVAGTWRTYNVEGCNVSINTDTDKQIVGLGMKVSPTCTFEWRDMYHNLTSLTSPDRTSIADFIGKVGLDHIQGCITGCGNSDEGGIFFLRKGSHADDWIDLKVGFVNDTSLEIEYSFRFRDIVDRELGEYSSADLSRLCDPRETEWARTTMGPIKIEYVEFSRFGALDFKYDDAKDCELGFLSALQ
ncbi:MAG: hypothetical protein ACXW3I_02870 [Allosphingosinicella sp.]